MDLRRLINKNGPEPLMKIMMTFQTLIYFTQFMDDDIPAERDTAIFMNLVLMSKCAEVWVFGSTVSSGMKAEIDRAKRKHMKIRYFSEELEETT
jgi:hypothetical protein